MKRGAAAAAPHLWETAEGTADSKVFVVGGGRRRILFRLLDGDSIALSQPASQVNCPAALATERKLGVFGGLSGHGGVAYRTPHLHHRLPRSRTSGYFRNLR